MIDDSDAMVTICGCEWGVVNGVFCCGRALVEKFLEDFVCGLWLLVCSCVVMVFVFNRRM